MILRTSIVRTSGPAQPVQCLDACAHRGSPRREASVKSNHRAIPIVAVVFNVDWMSGNCGKKQTISFYKKWSTRSKEQDAEVMKLKLPSARRRPGAQ